MKTEKPLLVKVDRFSNMTDKTEIKHDSSQERKLIDSNNTKRGVLKDLDSNDTDDIMDFKDFANDKWI